MTQQLSGTELALITNDLSQLTPGDRLAYYKQVCESLGINYLTQPFSYLQLNGKLVLYASRNVSDQLRSTRGITLQIMGRDTIGDVHVVTVRATTPDGRSDESIGAVSIGGLKGDALANALMKAETKAKRRVTLAICGLSMMDETELETVPAARIVNPDAPQQALPAPAVINVPMNRISAPESEPSALATPEDWAHIAELQAQLGWAKAMTADLLKSVSKGTKANAITRTQLAEAAALMEAMLSEQQMPEEPEPVHGMLLPDDVPPHAASNPEQWRH